MNDFLIDWGWTCLFNCIHQGFKDLFSGSLVFFAQVSAGKRLQYRERQIPTLAFAKPVQIQCHTYPYQHIKRWLSVPKKGEQNGGSLRAMAIKAETGTVTMNKSTTRSILDTCVLELVDLDSPAKNDAEYLRLAWKTQVSHPVVSDSQRVNLWPPRLATIRTSDEPAPSAGFEMGAGSVPTRYCNMVLSAWEVFHRVLGG